MTSSSTKAIEKIKRRMKPSMVFMTTDAEKLKEEHMLPVYIGYLTPKMEEIAKIELNESEEAKQKAIPEFRRLIESQENPEIRTDDEYLLQYLRARKFNVKKAFELLKNAVKFRKEWKSIYENNAYAKNVDALYLKHFIRCLPRRDKNGSVIIIVNSSAWDAEVEPMERMYMAARSVILYTIEDPATQIAGYRLIFDVREISWAQIKSLSLQKILMLLQSAKAFHGRYKGVHFITENKLFNITWAMTYPLFWTKLRSRISVLGSDLSSLQEYIDPLVLPVEYGGQYEYSDDSEWTELINHLKGLHKESDIDG